LRRVQPELTGSANEGIVCLRSMVLSLKTSRGLVHVGSFFWCAKHMDRNANNDRRSDRSNLISCSHPGARQAAVGEGRLTRQDEPGGLERFGSAGERARAYWAGI
jgi:hypothetical protein